MQSDKLYMNVYLNELGEPVGGEEWEAEVESKLQKIKKDLERELDFDVEVSSINLGAAADWLVVAITIASTGFFLIPATHKRLRETIEEWGRIFNHFKKLRQWLEKKYSVTMHSPGFSLIDAIDRLEIRGELDNAIFLDHSILPRRDYYPVINVSESADHMFVIGVTNGIRIYIYDNRGDLRSERIINFNS